VRGIDITGVRFGRLTVLYRIPNRDRGRYWRCRCDCGIEKDIRANSLKSGAVVSCTCYQRECATKAKTTHGLGRTPEFNAWFSLVNRCTDPESRAYASYGGRGITVCERWRTSVENFYEDMGPRPSPTHSIDRIDNDGPYSPENCRWATKTEQGNNRRTNVFLTHNGKTMTIAQWSQELGINNATLKSRVQHGWPIEDALLIVPSRRNKSLSSRTVLAINAGATHD
jgi:hypothetical protein